MALAGRAAGEGGDGGDGGRWWRSGAGARGRGAGGVGEFRPGAFASWPCVVPWPGLAPRGEFSGGEVVWLSLAPLLCCVFLRFGSSRL
jgi:hypothetical protein